MSDPTTTNAAATKADALIKDIEAVLVPMIQNLIIANVPSIGLPVVKQITGGIEQLIANYLTKYVEEVATDLIIDGQIKSEESGLSSAEKGESDADFQAAQSALINDSGSATPQ
jgi:hypothetical protein